MYFSVSFFFFLWFWGGVWIYALLFSGLGAAFASLPAAAATVEPGLWDIGSGMVPLGVWVG